MSVGIRWRTLFLVDWDFNMAAISLVQPADMTGETDTTYVPRLPVGEVRELWFAFNANLSDSEAAETWLEEMEYHEMISVISEEDLIMHELENI